MAGLVCYLFLSEFLILFSLLLFVVVVVYAVYCSLRLGKRNQQHMPSKVSLSSQTVILILSVGEREISKYKTEICKARQASSQTLSI